MIQDQIALERIQSFLKKNKLPAEDIKLKDSLYFEYRNENDVLIASGGFELYGDHALLRSVAIDETQRSRGLGKKIVDDLVEKAKELNITNLFLLTETAHDFFEKKGFADVDRNEVPGPIRNSTQFTSACPASACCMICKLN